MIFAERFSLKRRLLCLGDLNAGESLSHRAELRQRCCPGNKQLRADRDKIGIVTKVARSAGVKSTYSVGHFQENHDARKHSGDEIKP